MASENLAKLQATVNRYSDKADFSPLTIDGGMGPKTIAAIREALSLVGNDAYFTRARAWIEALDGASGDDVRASAIMNGLSDLNDILTGNANAQNLPSGATVSLTKPITVPSTVPDKSAFGIRPPVGMGPIDKARLWFRQQSTPVQVGVGAAGVFGVLGLFGFIRKKKGAR